MVIKQLKKQDISAISDSMSKKLLKQPLFMFFCPDVNKRSKFIRDYFRYYLIEWSKYDTLFMDESRGCAVTLVDPKTFEYKFRGKNSFKIRRHETSSSVFMHRENVEDIYDILMPPQKNTRVLTIYANPEADFESIKALVEEAVKIADEQNITLMYDTFSRKYIRFMESIGFVVSSSKQFLNTQYIETIMTYNM